MCLYVCELHEIVDRTCRMHTHVHVYAVSMLHDLWYRMAYRMHTYFTYYMHTCFTYRMHTSHAYLLMVCCFTYRMHARMHVYAVSSTRCTPYL
jgi:hypothetical protein